MAERHPSDSPGAGHTLLDDWRAEVGDEEIARIANETRRAADAGLILSFTDKESLLAHWRTLARRPG
jgi:hypothetical protein